MKSIKIMNEVPLEVRSKICNHVENINAETVHMGYASPLENDVSSFAVIVRDRVDFGANNSYSVFAYDSDTDIFQCFCSGLTYANALIEMGNYINE